MKEAEACIQRGDFRMEPGRAAALPSPPEENPGQLGEVAGLGALALAHPEGDGLAVEVALVHPEEVEGRVVFPYEAADSAWNPHETAVNTASKSWNQSGPRRTLLSR